MIFHTNLIAQIFTRSPKAGPARSEPAAPPSTANQINPTASDARIQHVNLAGESTDRTRQNIFVQSETVRLTRANPTPPSVLRLLQ